VFVIGFKGTDKVLVKQTICALSR